MFSRAFVTSAVALLLLALNALLWNRPDSRAAETPVASPAKRLELDRAPLQALLQSHCIDCHGAEEPEGGLDLTSLPADLSSPRHLQTWITIHDRVAARTMPPKAAEAPGDAVRLAFTASLGHALAAAHAQQKGTVLRRLNRREYENTLNDLFGTHLDLAALLPEDSRSREFDNVGEALGISAVQMQRYLEAAELVIDTAIAKRPEPPESTVVKASYAETRGAEEFLGKVWKKLPDGAVVQFRTGSYPSGMLREATVREDGWYEIRVTGYAYQSEKPITTAVGTTTYARGADRPTFGYYAFAPGAPTTVAIKAFMKSGAMVELTPQAIGDYKSEIKQVGLDHYQGPGLAIREIEIEGPLVAEWPSRGHHLLFDGLDRREVPPRNPNDRLKKYYVHKYEIVADNELEAVTSVLDRIAAKAFRRPVTSADLAPFQELFQAERAAGATFEEALRTTATAIFCSPHFLYLREQSGVLNDYELASRLAYFLTRTLPDEELLAAASNGSLARDPGVLEAQAARLLSSPHQERFVTDFTDAWLNLREIEATNPDDKLFPEFDLYLQWSMLEESRRFWQELVVNNEPVRRLIKPEFGMLNERLAEHYGIAGVTGPECRRVPLPADSVRGGLLAQAGVLKVSANGTNTSPVVRGVWVLERLLGTVPPPPPPGISGVEPDIRGATTLRELLERHRNLDSCRACHQMIDPPGFALESFDPIGGWRDHFRSLGDGEALKTEVRGRRVRYKIGPAVDAAGELPGGKKFAGYTEFRDLLAAEDRTLATTLVSKLLTFGTGRELGFSDRAEVERLVESTAANGYGLRDLLLATITSDIFRRK